MQVSEHALSVERSSGIFVPTVSQIRVRNRGPLLYLLIVDSNGSKRPAIPVRTPQAHKVGFDLIYRADDCFKEVNDGLTWAEIQIPSEFVILTVNGNPIHLPAKVARQLGAALLRRSDSVDDFQIKHRMRTTL